MNPFEIKDIPGKGRGMVSTKRFAKGDIILEEEPFVSSQFSWNAAYGYAACNHCMRPLETITENVHRLANNPLVHVPMQEQDPTLHWINQFTECKFCKTRYCCEDCRIDAYNKYHRFMCLGKFVDDDSHPINILNDTWKKMHYPPETSSIMLLVRLMAMYSQSKNKQEFMDQLKSFQSDIINRSENIYHKMLGESYEKQMEQLFMSFCNAFKSEEFSEFTTPDSFKALLGLVATNSQGIATSVLADWVKKASAIPLPTQQKEVLEEHINSIYSAVDEFAGEFLNNEGSGLYLIQSKINHSCIPNAASTFPYSSDIVVLEALKPIEPGEEICISYLDECQLNRSRHSRQKHLKENYIFVCSCPKCIEQAGDPNETSEDEEDDDGMDLDNDDDMME
ncbi:SET and MYND domain-containing protein 5 [Teleopsis dalmanni]|uniref:SET and MYND domain-containing protein 5 n=1 Tax=Teleopsis dalmanni TaxID=139649 RepID=UPI0018CCE444|nr:SET and MYND domain-containing protein 5 [Teleopsis dalmanni]